MRHDLSPNVVEHGLLEAPGCPVCSVMLMLWGVGVLMGALLSLAVVLIARGIG